MMIFPSEENLHWPGWTSPEYNTPCCDSTLNMYTTSPSYIAYAHRSGSRSASHLHSAHSFEIFRLQKLFLRCCLQLSSLYHTFTSETHASTSAKSQASYISVVQHTFDFLCNIVIEIDSWLVMLMLPCAITDALPQLSFLLLSIGCLISIILR